MFSTILFNLPVFALFPVFPWDWFLVSYYFCCKNCLIWVQSSWIYWYLLCKLNVTYHRECFMCTWEECAFCCFWMECSVNTIYIGLMRYLRPVFPYWFSVWMIYLSIDVSGVLKSPTVIVLLSISSFMTVNIFLIYWGVFMLGAYIFIIVRS